MDQNINHKHSSIDLLKGQTPPARLINPHENNNIPFSQ